uniref:PIG-L deacetylase family protein n=1 Tax=Halomonas sp. TaxID=1486246 RepID=UPI00260BDFAC|nr:PIG-L family deacetylase [Halomonas sp.]
MPIRRDHSLPLTPDVVFPARIDHQGRLSIDDKQGDVTSMGTATWLLEVTYHAGGRWKLPGVTTAENGQIRFTQYFECNETGKRLLNLTGIHSFDAIKLRKVHCTLDREMRLLGFKRPPLEDGPLMIIAPHPDDAELAAFGLYQHYAKNTWIVTLTAGETLKRLDKQYLPQLDDDLGVACRRKGHIRTWNSATTPLLAGVPAEQLVMLGYFNDTLSAMLAEPDKEIPSHGASGISVSDFRRWNHKPLASDQSPAINCGNHLLADLTALLDDIRPTTLVVTHPDIDPHKDHQAAASWLAQAMAQSQHQPQRVLLYANHLKGVRGFPRGPVFAAAGLWPVAANRQGLLSSRIFSEPLDTEAIREKAVAMDSMHDLRARTRLDKALKQWLAWRLSGLPKSTRASFGEHDYFRTHLKAQENFTEVTAETFMSHLNQQA